MLKTDFTISLCQNLTLRTIQLYLRGLLLRGEVGRGRKVVGDDKSMGMEGEKI